MSTSDSYGVRIHEDPDLFREAVSYTAARTAFAPRLIEQDYFCTQLLKHLSAGDAELVFKGGTCLAKVHVDFYRMSEDLDFIIPMPVDASRGQRSNRVAGLKKAVGAFSGRRLLFQVDQPLTGASDSRQYAGVIGYTSPLTGLRHSIKVEVGLCEPVLMPKFNGAARTVLLDPVSGRPLVLPVVVQCLSILESFAEKFRAALSRRDAAIRDFFDIDYAVHRRGLVSVDSELLDLIRRKLNVPGNEPIDISPSRIARLSRQVASHLKPVLRDADLTKFDLERALRTVTEVGLMLG